ncbi:hypothetical protein, partial [Stenotrophomonas sp. Sm0581]
RKPIHGGLAAASMPRTPPQPDPPRLRQFPAICRDGFLRCFWWVSTLVDTMNTATTEGVRSDFLWKTDLTPTFQMAGVTLDASADNGEDGGWFFRLALHGATHP